MQEFNQIRLPKQGLYRSSAVQIDGKLEPVARMPQWFSHIIAIGAIDLGENAIYQHYEQRHVGNIRTYAYPMVLNHRGIENRYHFPHGMGHLWDLVTIYDVTRWEALTR